MQRTSKFRVLLMLHCFYSRPLRHLLLLALHPWPMRSVVLQHAAKSYSIFDIAIFGLRASLQAWCFNACNMLFHRISPSPQPLDHELIIFQTNGAITQCLQTHSLPLRLQPPQILPTGISHPSTPCKRPRPKSEATSVVRGKSPFSDGGKGVLGHV